MSIAPIIMVQKVNNNYFISSTFVKGLFKQLTQTGASQRVLDCQQNLRFLLLGTTQLHRWGKDPHRMARLHPCQPLATPAGGTLLQMSRSAEARECESVETPVKES